MDNPRVALLCGLHNKSGLAAHRNLDKTAPDLCSMHFDLLIKNVRMVFGEELVVGDIGVVGGRIAALAVGLTGEADVKVEGRGLLALPGLIDPHVHFREPGQTHKEDFESGSRGAAAGGVTTVFDMPNNIPPTTSLEAFRLKLEAASSKSHVNFGLYACASTSNLAEISPLSKAGAIGFKTYTVRPTVQGAREFEGCVAAGTAELFQVMEATSKTGLTHVVHAEDDGLVGYFTAKLRGEGRIDPQAHADSRPNMAEELAVHRAIALAELTGVKLHFAHITTKQALEEIRRAKARGLRVTCEVTPHHLLLDRGSLERFGAKAKFNPPPRSREDVSALIAGLKDGSVDAIASDHAPHTLSEKEAGRANIWDAPAGTPGVETLLPIVLTKAGEWGLSLTDIARLCSRNAAKIFGLVGRKGAIAVGYDADITLVDPYAEWTLSSDRLQSKSRETFLFEGMRVRGKVKYTFVCGQPAYEEGVGFSKPGTGRFVAGPMLLPQK